ncbi:choice-of-anchor D domain-containing protein [Thermodesulfobacteriota bacterium]
MRSSKILMNVSIFFLIAILSPDFSESAIDTQGYDFGNVEMGSTQTNLVNISNLDSVPVVLTWITIDKDGCSDISVVTLPESMTISPNGSVNVEIGYSPSFVGECSASLRIFTGSPLPSNQVIFTGTGVEQEPMETEPNNISQILLEKHQEIINYTNEDATYKSFKSQEQDKLSENRMNTFKKMLAVTYHLIENGHFGAAQNKLRAIYKKVDGKPKSNDFVSSDKATHLALMLHDLIDSFGFED